MTSRELSRSVVVFDLDDTLYPESDYVQSGIRHVGAWIEGVCGITLRSQVDDMIARPQQDWIGRLCAAAELPQTAKESLLWMYRLHSPEIRLDVRSAQVLQELEQKCLQVLVLTDGRSVTQRLKLQALGLSQLRAYISEDYQSEKPDTLRFRAIEQDFPAASYIYVGDNPRKDFVGCKALGWTTVGLRGANTIHSQDLGKISPEALPDHWIDGLQELLELLC